jgi:hypothetical protein
MFVPRVRERARLSSADAPAIRLRIATARVAVELPVAGCLSPTMIAPCTASKPYWGSQVNEKGAGGSAARLSLSIRGADRRKNLDRGAHLGKRLAQVFTLLAAGTAARIPKPQAAAQDHQAQRSWRVSTVRILAPGVASARRRYLPALRPSQSECRKASTTKAA